MTAPNLFDGNDDYAKLRRTWYSRYLSVQSNFDGELRRMLDQAAIDAQRRINKLASSKNYEDRVRLVQIRLAKNEVKITLKEMFDGVGTLIKGSQRQAAKAAAEALTATDRKYLYEAFGSTHGVSGFIEWQQKSAMLGVANAIARVTKSRQPLSNKVFKTRSLANNWVDRAITSGIIRGDSASDIAKAVRNHIRPDTPGGVSYAAMRLGRTELNNAFHATSITLAQDRPWIEGMSWNLSATHKPLTNATAIPEICEIYAAKIWHVDQVPPKPHPQCRCFVAPKLEAFETFQRHLTAGQYRDWMENAA